MDSPALCDTGVIKQDTKIKHVSIIHTRIGNRLVKLEMESEEEVRKVLVAKRALRNAGEKWRNIVLFADRAPHERTSRGSHQPHSNFTYPNNISLDHNRDPNDPAPQLASAPYPPHYTSRFQPVSSLNFWRPPGNNVL